METVKWLQALVESLFKRYASSIDGLGYVITEGSQPGELTITTTDGNRYAIDITDMGQADTVKEQ